MLALDKLKLDATFQVPLVSRFRRKSQSRVLSSPDLLNLQPFLKKKIFRHLIKKTFALTQNYSQSFKLFYSIYRLRYVS